MVERKLASGGMASVYRGYDPSLDRPIAIKVLRPELATARGAERFLREARNLAHLSHPNIVAIHEVGEADGLFFYVMDYVDTPTLRELLTRGPIPTSESVRVATDLLKALEAVHAAGLVHRDVKPGNVFVTPDRVLLGDFGIAKAVEVKQGETLTSDGQVVGTPGYMAPEQNAGDQITPRSDLYAVGLVLFQCLTGRNFGEADTLPADVTWTGVPARIRRVLERSLARDPEDRWPDAGAFRMVLTGTARAEQTTASAGWFRGRRLALVVMVLAAASAALGIAFSRLGESGGRAVVAIQPCDDLSDGDHAYFAFGFAEALKNELRTIPGLRVASSRDTPGVEFAVDCRVWTDQDQRVIELALVDRGGDTLWQSDARQLSLAFPVHRELARDIVAVLPGVEIPDDAFPPLRPGQTTTLSLTQLDSLGRDAWWERTEDGLHAAERFYEQALALDSTYAPAHAGLAEVYVVLTARGLRDLTPDSAFRVALQHAERAIQLDSTRGESYAARAEARRSYFWEMWTGAGDDYRTAIRLNPVWPLAHTWYSLYWSAMGRHDSAIAEARTALELDLGSPNMSTGLAVAHFYNRDYARALAELSRAFALDPNFTEARLWQIGVLLMTDRHEQARSLLDEVARLAPPVPLYRAVLAYGFAAADRDERARELLERLERQLASGDVTYVSPFWMAVAHAALDERDKAFEWLESALKVRDEFMVHLKVSPFVDPLRGDPRFSAIEDSVSAYIGS